MKSKNKLLVLEYSIEQLPSFVMRRIRLYSDGVVEVFGDHTKLDLLTDTANKRELQIPAQQVISYAEELSDAGFFDLNDRYSSYIYDGVHESLTLSYGGKSKTIKCQNARPSLSEFEQVIGELHKLMQQPE